MRNCIVSIFWGMLLFCSCSDWLDVKPKTTVEENDIFSRELGFKEALTGIYIKMASTDLYARNLSYGFLDILGQRYENDELFYSGELFYTFPSTKTESYTEKIWGEMYNVIANVNNLLYYCDKNRQVFTTEHYYEIIKGEVLGLRAFLHFDLLRMYGPIYKDHPTAKRIAYRTKFDNEPKEMQASNVVVDSIIADLKKAEILLRDTDPLYFEFPVTDESEMMSDKDAFLVYRHKRMNLYAVKALLARVYLYAGNKSEAENYANQVIESDYFELVGEASDILRSKEIVFSVYVDKFDQQVEEITNNTFYSIMNKSFLNEMFDVANDGMNDVRVREGVAFDYASNGRSTMRKYKQENLWVSTKGTVVLIRLSEMYYVLAECAKTPEEAAVFLNKVREIRGIDYVVCTESNLLNEIEKEYRKEFYGEGQLFFFYKRHGYPTFLHCPVNNMVENNYMFSWPDNESLFGKTN
ncbi:RagB/SusD family nutrient uptake outer membrane protein [Butyricimonas sp.]|uniref:RagB/SusD family nutrient uptake outer membrane protein n=1 Tax=Butyricimonas sp. TaxID=1969738 RepID=UPI0025BBE121|nr:RagB/SusD family nutrient uptake outer membrane protein [Butyricimonas sp.]